jgi:hypothetical protein
MVVVVVVTCFGAKQTCLIQVCLLLNMVQATWDGWVEGERGSCDQEFSNQCPSYGHVDTNNIIPTKHHNHTMAQSHAKSLLRILINIV